MIIQIFIHRDNRGQIESIDWLEIKNISEPLLITQLIAFEDFITKYPEQLVDENEHDLGRAMVATIDICFYEGDIDWDIECEGILSIDDEYPECFFLQEIKHPDSVCGCDDSIPF